MAVIITQENGQIECSNEMLKMQRKVSEGQYTQLMPIESCEGIIYNTNNLVMKNSRYVLPHIQLNASTVDEACEEIESRMFKGGRTLTKMEGSTSEINDIIDSCNARNMAYWHNKYVGLFLNITTKTSYLLGSDDGKIFNSIIATFDNARLNEMCVLNNKLYFIGNVVNNTSIVTAIYYVNSLSDTTLRRLYTIENIEVSDINVHLPSHIITDKCNLFATCILYETYKTKVTVYKSLTNSIINWTTSTTEGETLHSRPCSLGVGLFISQFDTVPLRAYSVGLSGDSGTSYSYGFTTYSSIAAISRDISDGGNYFLIVENGTNYLRQVTFDYAFRYWLATSDSNIQSYSNNFDMMFRSPLYLYNGYDSILQKYRVFYGEKKYDNALYTDCKPILLKNTDTPVQEMMLFESLNNMVYAVGITDNKLYYTVWE